MTAGSTTPIGRPGGSLPARYWCCGRVRTIPKSWLAIRWPSGGRGLKMCGGVASSAATTWPKSCPTKPTPSCTHSSVRNRRVSAEFDPCADGDGDREVRSSGCGTLRSEPCITLPTRRSTSPRCAATARHAASPATPKLIAVANVCTCGTDPSTERSSLPCVCTADRLQRRAGHPHATVDADAGRDGLVGTAARGVVAYELPGSGGGAGVWAQRARPPAAHRHGRGAGRPDAAAECRHVCAAGAHGTRRQRMAGSDDYLVVQDVPAAVAFFRDQFGLRARVSQTRYAELEAGPVTMVLRTDAPGQAEPPALQMVHFEVSDVAGVLARARGLTVHYRHSGCCVGALLPPTRSDRGSSSRHGRGDSPVPTCHDTVGRAASTGRLCRHTRRSYGSYSRRSVAQHTPACPQQFAAKRQSLPCTKRT